MYACPYSAAMAVSMQDVDWTHYVYMIFPAELQLGKMKENLRNYFSCEAVITLLRSGFER